MSGPEEDTPLEPAAVRNPDNVELARAVGNIVLEAQAHRMGMRALYEQLCAMSSTPPRMWGLGLVEEYERHIKRMQEGHLPALKAAVAVG